MSDATMTFRRRVHPPLVNATARTLAALRQRGIAVINLTVSNPTDVGLHYAADLLQPLGSKDALAYRPSAFGLQVAREAVRADFDRRGFDVPIDRIVLAASTSEAYSWLFKLLCDPGDAVLVPQPSYPLFEHLAVLDGVEATPYRLEYHGSWRIDLADLQAAVTPRTRAVIVVSPNNPTGSLLHDDDLVALDALCAEHELLLIGDEVFADFVSPAVTRSPSVLQASQAVVVSLGGLSKTVGLPQVKLAWMAFSGPSGQVAALLETLELIADTYLSVSTPVQVALPELLRRGADVRRQIQDRLVRNHETLVREVAREPAISLLDWSGGWSVVLQAPRYRSEEALVLELLTQDHVLVHPGFFYDFEREAFLVLSLLCAPDDFDRAVPALLRRAAAPGAS